MILDPASLTWTCDVCHEERPDAAIAVFKRDVSEAVHQPPGHVQVNTRYCMDREACARDVFEVSAGRVAAFFAVAPSNSPHVR